MSTSQGKHIMQVTLQWQISVESKPIILHQSLYIIKSSIKKIQRNYKYIISEYFGQRNYLVFSLHINSFSTNCSSLLIDTAISSSCTRCFVSVFEALQDDWQENNVYTPKTYAFINHFKAIISI